MRLLSLLRPALLGMLTAIPAMVVAEQTSPTASSDGSESILHDFGAANRIVASETLRALSQEIPAAACHLYNEVDTAEASELLEHSVTTFDKMLNALLHGDAELGIEGAETRRRTIVELEHLITDWMPIHDAALRLVTDPSDAAAVDLIYSSTDAMFEKTYHLLIQIEAEYTHPTEVLQSDMMLLEVAGRLAATNQHIAYEACRVWSNTGDDAIVADLRQSIEIYDGTIAALAVGMPGLGILPPPTDEIDAQLATIRQSWDETQGMLSQVAQLAEVTPDMRFDIYHALAAQLHDIEALEVLYQDYAKRLF